MKKYVLPAVCVVCVLALTAMLVSLLMTGQTAQKNAFVPPAFDSAAESGTPNVPENAGYSEIAADGMSFSAYVCGRVLLQGKNADIYFTNVAGNEVLLKLRILDENNSILAETGLLKPGEYVKTVTFSSAPENGAKIKLKIMSYEPETYYSAGAVSLNTTITKGE